jgi:hypothetical protein
MSVHASPGAYFEILDLSIYAPQLSTTNLALIGKSSKGPINPTYCTTVRQFIDTFGTPRKGDYSSLAAVSYLEYGSSLWYKRIVGNAAKAAEVEIPKAINVVDEKIATADKTGNYIYKATLNSKPVPGTVEIKITDPNNSDNFMLINDTDNGDNTGYFSSYYNSSVSNYSNFIDYDSGDFRFTIDQKAIDSLNTSSTKTVSLTYNKKSYSVTNESIKTLTATGSKTYSGYFKYNNISADSVKIYVTTTVDNATLTYTFTPASTGTDGVYVLTGKNGDNTVSDTSAGSNLINTKTGFWKITLNTSTTDLNVGDVILASYSHTNAKTKTLGIIGEANGTDSVYGLAYIGTVNSVIYPGSVEIHIVESTPADTIIAVDNFAGKFVKYTEFAINSIVSADNKVNYLTGELSVSVVTPPTNGFVITANYMSKYSKTVKAVASTNGITIASTVDTTPIVKGSVIVLIDETHYFADEYDSNTEDYVLVAHGDVAGNGVINYDTGVISVNSTYGTADSDVEITYLSTYAKATAISKGEYYTGTKLEFYKDKFYGYGLKVWTPEQKSTQTPEENWKSITFTDSSKADYILNKVISNWFTITLYDESSNTLPVLNNILTMTGGNDDANNINEASAVTAIEDFANYETYDINLIACPDFPGNKTVIAKLFELCESTRGDCFALVDPPQNLTPQNVVAWHNGDGLWSNENALNTSFGALYYPWIQISDSFTESLQWVPPSVKVAGAYAYNDAVSEVWNAPAGLNRGRLTTALKLERQLTIGERDLLYATGTNAVNPICDFVSDGIVIYGQKTLQRKPSALDRVNVMRLLIYVTKILATAVKYLLFEPNDSITWLHYTQTVQPLLDRIKDNRGFYEFKIVCDSSTNTSYYVDNNTMCADIWMKPTKTGERIITRYIITSTSASFDELASTGV